MVKETVVYIMANKKYGTLYRGVTSFLVQRVCQHKESTFKGFAEKYGCKNLVFYELHESMVSAIAREKQIKAGSRKSKMDLIESINPKWQELYEDIAF